MLSKKPKEVYRRAWKRRNPRKAYAAMKRWIKRHPGKQAILARNWKLKQFGLLPKDEKARCEPCGDLFVNSKRCTRMFIDHCHKTNKFRGFLCMRCNMALGYLQDDPKRILKLLSYIQMRG
jgi:Recombination endonuclease VII